VFLEPTLTHLHAKNFGLLKMSRLRLAVGDYGVAGDIRMTNVEGMRKQTAFALTLQRFNDATWQSVCD